MEEDERREIRPAEETTDGNINTLANAAGQTS